MADDRELARELLEGKVSVEDVARMRSSGVPVRGVVVVSGGAGGPVTGPPVVAAGAVAEVKGAVVTCAPSTDRKFPCKNCGARLDFDPSCRALKCPYCGFVEEIAPTTLKVQEHDYSLALKKLAEKNTEEGAAGGTGMIAGRSDEVRCPGCGANVLIEDKVATDKCPFCATHLENVARVQAGEMILPECLLPFRISQRESIEAFNKWIASRWFAPNHLKDMANLGQLSGIYIPFWTYDSMTYTQYTGQRGDDYWDTESYTDSQGHSQTREVRRTRWTYVSGEVDHFFDDVLVCASKSLPAKDVGHLEPWDLKDLEDFKADYLAGFKTERYVVGLPEGFGVAQVIMDRAIRSLCTADIGGDHQQLSTVNTQHVGVTYKHILLPLWLAVYRYQDQTYRILVNARTGEVAGTRPYSFAKIALAVLAGLAAVIIIVLLFAASQHR